jgi:hypothetical protein
MTTPDGLDPELLSALDSRLVVSALKSENAALREELAEARALAANMERAFEAVRKPLRDLARRLCAAIGYGAGAEPEGAEAVAWLDSELERQRVRGADLEEALMSARAEVEALRATRPDPDGKHWRAWLTLDSIANDILTAGCMGAAEDLIARYPDDELRARQLVQALLKRQDDVGALHAHAEDAVV